MLQNRSRLHLAYLAMLLGIFCIGLSAIFVKLAAVPGPASAFYRVAIAALVLVPWRLARPGAWPRGQALTLTVLGGMFFALDLAMWNTALLLTSAAEATLLANNAPLWVGLGARLIFKERLIGLYWIGLALALVGMVLVVRPAAGGLALGLGSALAFTASLAYAAYLLLTQQARATTDTLTFMAVSMGVGSAVLLALCLALGTPLVGYPLTSWAALLGLALISQVGGWLAINFALGHLPATQASVSLLGQVLVTTVLAALLFDEIPGLLQVVGGALVLGGIYLVTRARQIVARGSP